MQFKIGEESDPHSDTEILYAGTPVESAETAIIFLHGRGATANDILQLSAYFNSTEIAFLAPQAANCTWYPYSFLSPVKQNEPFLSSALQKVGSIISSLRTGGLKAENIYLLGFSQGACLALGFAALNSEKFGGIFGLSGGLIGETVDRRRYTGDMKETPVFLGCSDQDPHIPLTRVDESASVFREMNADVTTSIYPDMGHTINGDEIRVINSILKG